MLILGPILWNKAVEDGFHIHADVRVGILIDAQSTARMLAEYVHDARLRQLGQLTHYLAGHQMESARLGL